MTKEQKIITAAALPLLFAGLTIFITYEYINVFLIGGLLLLITEAFLLRGISKTAKKTKDRLKVILPFMLIVAGSIGISASTTLTREKLQLLENPDYVTSCSISPVVACSPVINSEQASLITDLPNPLFGIFGYTAMLVAGMTILAMGSSVKIASWWWRVLWLGTLAEMVFSAVLIYESLYDIGALCIYCMSVWAINIPLFVYLSLYNFQQGHLPINKKWLEWFEKNHLFVLSAIFGFIILLIYFRFDYYWNSLI